jgi:hypothetical protein
MKVYIIKSIAKSYIFNIKIRPLVTEYALMIKLVGLGRKFPPHSFNPYAYYGHSWSYFDIQNLRLAILYPINHNSAATPITGQMIIVHQKRYRPR